VRFAAYVILLIGVWAETALAASIDSIQTKLNSAGSVEISFSGADIEPANVNIFEIPGESPRIVVDITETHSPLLKNGIYLSEGQGDVKAIRAATRDNGIRFVMDVSDSALNYPLRGTTGL